MELHNITKILGTKGKSKIVGRGIGSGKGGHTTGKGNKGQKSRSGRSLWQGFEGGQVPLYKRFPQFGGFKNPTTKDIVAINLDTLNAFKDGSNVMPKDLVIRGVFEKLSRNTVVKILGTGSIKKKLTLKGFTYSKSAKETLEKAGCELQA